LKVRKGLAILREVEARGRADSYYLIMADIKFACPHCQQHLQAEPGYAGLQIVCPACQRSFTVPGNVVAAAPVAAAAPAYAAAPSRALAPAAVQAPAPATASACPSCGGALPRGAVLCTQCGYNLATGKRTVAGRPAPLGKPSTPQWQTAWYKTPYPYLGAVVVVLGVLYFLGRENPGMMLAFLGAALLYSLTVHIMVVVAAFRESVGTGFLTLCIPFYALYFVFKVSDNNTLKLLYSVAVVINITLKFIGKLGD
jgi:hypothetical protein